MIAGGNKKFMQMSIAGSLRFLQYFSSFLSLRFIEVEVRNEYRNVRAYISFVLSSTCLLIRLFICYFICLSICLISFTFFLSVCPSIHSPKYRMFHQLSYTPLQPFIQPARLLYAFRQALFQTRPMFDVRLWQLTESGYIDWHEVIDTRELAGILPL